MLKNYMLKTDIEKLNKIIDYCDKIDKIINSHNDSKKEYMDDYEFQLATDMCVFQIGEIANHISEEFKMKNANIPWTMIKGMRNIHAHDYEVIDREVMWNTIKNDILDLKNKLNSIK